ncbi:MAG TPA: DUF1800 domain-containing protein [Pirellulales bacterium]|nr:DUF1800 domain-containing protein [Pirellulales bacterium]
MKAEQNPWSPYEASAADPWDHRKVAHLHRRAGFGATRGEIERDLAAGPAASIARFLEPEPEPQAFRQISDALRRAAEGGERDYSRSPEELASWWLFRMAYGPDPLGEKLTLFWHGHFATAIHGVYRRHLMTKQNELLRKHARGRFGDLLRAIEADPAMLIWLDGGANHKNHPNENFARELLELFTLGIGNYSEQDVREAARALTGWRRDRESILLNETDDFTYEEDLADTGEKNFLGQRGPWRKDDVMRIILGQPAAAQHICRRLYRAFVSEAAEPSAELIEPLAAEFRASDYSIGHVVGIMLRSRHFFSPDVYRRRVKSPVDYCVGTIRQLALPRSPGLLMLAVTSCQEQGQALFDPPSVKGWDGGAAWLSSATTLARMNWVVELLNGNESSGLAPYDGAAWAKANNVAAGQLVAAYTALLVDDDVSAGTRELASQLAGSDATHITAALQVLLQAPEHSLA